MMRPSPFRDIKTAPEVIRLAVMLYVRFPLSLRNVEDVLAERGIEVSPETVRFCAAANYSAYNGNPTAIVQPSRRLDQRTSS